MLVVAAGTGRRVEDEARVDTVALGVDGVDVVVASEVLLVAVVAATTSLVAGPDSPVD